MNCSDITSRGHVERFMHVMPDVPSLAVKHFAQGKECDKSSFDEDEMSSGLGTDLGGKFVEFVESRAVEADLSGVKLEV